MLQDRALIPFGSASMTIPGGGTPTQDFAVLILPMTPPHAYSKPLQTDSFAALNIVNPNGVDIAVDVAIDTTNSNPDPGFPLKPFWGYSHPEAITKVIRAGTSEYFYIHRTDIVNPDWVPPNVPWTLEPGELHPDAFPKLFLNVRNHHPTLTLMVAAGAIIWSNSSLRDE